MLIHPSLAKLGGIVAGEADAANRRGGDGGPGARDFRLAAARGRRRRVAAGSLPVKNRKNTGAWWYRSDFDSPIDRIMSHLWLQTGRRIYIPIRHSRTS